MMMVLRRQICFIQLTLKIKFGSNVTFSKLLINHLDPNLRKEQISSGTVLSSCRHKCINKIETNAMFMF